MSFKVLNFMFSIYIFQKSMNLSFNKTIFKFVYNRCHNLVQLILVWISYGIYDIRNLPEYIS